MTFKGQKTERTGFSFYAMDIPESKVVVAQISHIGLVLRYKPVRISLQSIKYQIQSRFRQAKKSLKWSFKHKVMKQPIYTLVSTTDCDMCSSTYYKKYENGFEYEEFQSNEKNFEWLEGPYSENFVTEEEYLEYGEERFTRDRVMEAYENGNGNLVVV